MTTIAALDTLSTEELEALLKSRKKKENAAREAAFKAYTTQKDQDIVDLMAEGRDLAQRLAVFKTKAHRVMDIQAEKQAEYGLIRTSSKGGFSITHSDGQQRVTRRRDTDPVFNELASKGVELISDFLGDKIKKRDKDTYELLMGFLSKNAKNELDYASVFSLMQHENRFDDSRWIEGLKLLKESYSLIFKAFAYEFKAKTAAGKWEPLQLNFYNL